MDMDNGEFESSCKLFEDTNAAGDGVIGTDEVDKRGECGNDGDSEPDTDSDKSDGEPRDDNNSDDEPANDNSHREDGAYVGSENDNEDHVNDYGAGERRRMSPPRIQVQQVDFTTPCGRQFSKRRRSCDISAGSRHSKASKRSVSSVASSVQGPVSRSASPLDTNLQGASRISGGLFRGKAVGNAGNNADYGLFCQFLLLFLLSHYWSDVPMDLDDDLPVKVSGKVLLYVNRDAEEPLMAIRQEVTPDLSTILQGLSVYYSPVKSKSKGMFPVFFLILFLRI